MAEKTAKSDKSEKTDSSKSGNGKSTSAAVGRSVSAVRGIIAKVVWLICLVAAVFLAVGALLIALHGSVNEKNSIVKLVTDIADFFDGPFTRKGGVFDFHGKSAEVKNALANWGLAAILYLVVGRLLARLIRR